MAKSIKTGLKFMDNMLDQPGIRAGSVIVVAYEDKNHGVRLLENLGTRGYKTRYITSSRASKKVLQSMKRIVDDKTIKEKTRITSCKLENFAENILGEAEEMTDENIIIEDFGRMIGSLETESQAVKIVKQLSKKIMNTEKILFLGIKKENLNKYESLSTITSTADGVIELKTEEKGEEVKNILVLRRLAGESQLPTATGVKASDKYQKGGAQDLR